MAPDCLCLGSGDYNSAVKLVWVGTFVFSLFNYAALGRGLRLFVNPKGNYSFPSPLFTAQLTSGNESF